MTTNYKTLLLIAVLSTSLNIAMFHFLDKKNQEIWNLQQETACIHTDPFLHSTYISNEKYDVTQGITFIWNDDEESIPKDGDLIRLQYTDEDTIYIGPADLTDEDVSYIQEVGLKNY